VVGFAPLSPPAPFANNPAKVSPSLAFELSWKKPV